MFRSCFIQVLCLVLLFVNRTFSYRQNKKPACITPNNEHAYCVLIHECIHIRDAVLTLDDTFRRFAIASVCKKEGNYPYICCGSRIAFLNETNTLSNAEAETEDPLVHLIPEMFGTPQSPPSEIEMPPSTTPSALDAIEAVFGKPTSKSPTENLPPRNNFESTTSTTVDGNNNTAQDAISLDSLIEDIFEENMKNVTTPSTIVDDSLGKNTTQSLDDIIADIFNENTEKVTSTAAPTIAEPQNSLTIDELIAEIFDGHLENVTSRTTDAVSVAPTKNPLDALIAEVFDGASSEKPLTLTSTSGSLTNTTDALDLLIEQFFNSGQQTPTDENETFSTKSADVDGNCTTPNKEIAHCIPITNCPMLLDEYDHFNESIRQFAVHSLCDYLYAPYVCCGSDSIFKSDNRIKAKFPTNCQTDSNTNVTDTGRSLLPCQNNCGYQRTDDVILTDNDTSNLDAFPWMVIVSYEFFPPNASVVLICSGSLISQRYVLTSAKCVDFVGLEVLAKLNIKLGEYHRYNSSNCKNSLGFPDCAESMENILVEEIIIHPGYQRTPLNHDIALLRLERNVGFSDYIRPICLPDANSDISISVGDHLTTSGWGASSSGNLSSGNKWVHPDNGLFIIRTRSQNEILSRNDCAKIFPNERIDAFKMCSRTDTNCSGSNGGPAMIADNNRWFQVGLISGTGNCEKNTTLHLDLSKYVDWIAKSLRP